MESNARRLTTEFRTPEFLATKRVYGGKEYHSIRIPGYHQTFKPGEPQLPFQGYLLGLPGGAKAELKIHNADHEILSGYYLLPAPEAIKKQQLPKNIAPDFSYKWQPDQKIYSSASFYPRQIARLAEPGIIRNQLVCALQIYPIQFNPITRKIRYYKTITVEITFVPGNKEPNAAYHTIKPDTSKPIEKILSRTLLNYQTAKNWKIDSSPTFSPKPAYKMNAGQTGNIWYKIEVEHDGIFKIDRAQLENAGLNISRVDPKKIRMFHKGAEIPIHIKGQKDARFDADDYVEFYGQKPNNSYTNTNIYWLTVDDAIAGRRMFEKDGSLAGTAPVSKQSKETVHFEREVYYATSIPNGEDADHWFWNFIIAPNSLNLSAHLTNVSGNPEGESALRIAFRGFSDTPANPDHHTIVSLNGLQILDDYWDGQVHYLSHATIPQDQLANGENTVAINLPGDTGVDSDVIYVDWLEIDYWREYFAHDDSIMFWAEGVGLRQMDLKNFSNPNIALFDVTDALNIKKIKGFDISQDGTASALSFQDSLTTRQRYFALTEDKKRIPKISADEPSQLQSPDNQADYIIVVHENFYGSLLPLAQFRQQQGLNVRLVKISDVYDEFNHGIKNPRAIKDFLRFAFHQWQKPPPTYALLAGDASYDYKDHLQTGRRDYMPTHLFESNYFNTETSSDNWFACVSGDDNLPDMLIGRLPVQSPAEAESIVAKIIQYENHNPTTNWPRAMLFIADDSDGYSNSEAMSDSLIRRKIPRNITVDKIYVSHYSNPQAIKNEIIDKINHGYVIANYIGHGSIEFLAQEQILHNEDIPRLQNGAKQPFMILLSCLNGFFHHAEIDSSEF